MKRMLMETLLVTGLFATVTGAAWAGFPKTPLKKCADDAVLAGTTCVDRYEASVWRVPDPAGANRRLVSKIKNGKATLSDLVAAGATQLGFADDYAPCTHDGQNCADDIYAVSLAGVAPAAFATWFRAQEACANSGKRLPTNAEWQLAANGSPDPGPDDGATDCNSTGLFGIAATGARSSCVSTRGAHDMVGNLWEWVADWVPASTACSGWGAFSNDSMCLAGAGTLASGPGAFLRGGSFVSGVLAGPLAISPDLPSVASDEYGFRCAR